MPNKLVWGESVIRTIGIIVFVLSLLAVSDFGLFLFGYPFFGILALIASVTFIVRKKSVDDIIVIFIGGAAAVFCLVNLYFVSNYNFVVFTPLLALFFVSFLADNRRDTLRFCLDLIAFGVIPLLVGMEMAAKLSQQNFFMMEELVKQTGNGRFDVLRAQSPFASPLSLASLCLALAIAYTFFYRSLPRASFVLAVAVLTGSRTIVFIIAGLLAGYMTYEALFGEARAAWMNRTTLLQFSLPHIILTISVFLIDFFVGSHFWSATIGRIFKYSSVAISEDASFVGRAETMVAGAAAIVASPWQFLLHGSANVPPLDSAFLSIAWQSGLPSALLLYGSFLYFLFKSDMSIVYRAAIAVSFLVVSMMTGDAIVPMISIIYFSVFYSFKRDSNKVEVFA